jgi:hypothetical protein
VESLHCASIARFSRASPGVIHSALVMNLNQLCASRPSQCTFWLRPPAVRLLLSRLAAVSLAPLQLASPQQQATDDESSRRRRHTTGTHSTATHTLPAAVARGDQLPRLQLPRVREEDCAREGPPRPQAATATAKRRLARWKEWRVALTRCFSCSSSQFRQHRSETDPATLQSLLTRGSKDLRMLQRQSLINQLYSSGESIIEKSIASGKPAGSLSSSSSFTLKTAPSYPRAFQAWLASAHISGDSATPTGEALPADEADVQARESPQQHKQGEQPKFPEATGPMPEN